MGRQRAHARLPREMIAGRAIRGGLPRPLWEYERADGAGRMGAMAQEGQRAADGLLARERDVGAPEGGGPAPAPDMGLRLLCRLAAEVVGAPWAALAARDGEAAAHGEPPAALTAAAAGLAPAEGRVEVARLATGWAAAVALPGGGVLAALFPARPEIGARAGSELCAVARLAAAGLGADARIARERDLMRMALDNMDQGLLVIEPDMSVPVLSRRTAELLRFPPEFLATRPGFPELIAYQHATGAISDEVRGAWFNAYILNLEHLPEVDAYERETIDGKTLEVRTTRLPGGGFARTFTDQTARRQREAAIAAADAENRRLFENSIVGLYRATPDGRPIRANAALARLNGFASPEAFLAAMGDPRAFDVEPGRLDAFLARLRRDGRVEDFVSEVYRPADSQRIWIAETAWALHDATGAMIGFEGAVVDATERRRAEEAAARLARTDALTGLGNRAAFLDGLAAALAEGAPAAVLLLDLDRFKGVNDTLGHHAGDALLQGIAGRIAALAGPGDVVARFGGDEFALILAGADEAAATAAAERALAAVRAPTRIANRDVALGASIGLALAPRDGRDPTGLMMAADMALYRAKGAGRYAWRAFLPEMADEMAARRRMELDLRAALDRDEFGLAYQPVIDAAAGRAVGYEALLRWTHPERGAVPPETFIAIAEEARLIGPIGAWALARACADAARWPGERDLWVNVSAVQLAHGAFEEELAAALAASGFPRRRLVLEITETSLMESRADLEQLIARLRAGGVRVALDDFGTGYSSLGYLRRFRFDVIKIDRSFVRDLDQPAAAAIVASVLDLAARLGMAAVAEGVETDAQRAALCAAGCGFLQGHLFGPLLDAQAIGRSGAG